jgi:hypothetical protein
MDRLAQDIWPENYQSVEFRGTDILGGKKHWRGIGKNRRIEAYRAALAAIGESSHVRLFGAVIHKAAIFPDDPMEYAFEQVCNRFDRFLGRLHKSNDTQRGLIVLDESSYETALQGLAINFRTVGHRWGRIYNLSDVPLFVNSRATRMIQYADLVAHALRRYYDRGDSQFFDIISHRFDAVGGIVHGLSHYVPNGEPCNCMACRQRPAAPPHHFGGQ